MKRSRELCDRCHRVQPRACLCHALPLQKHPLQDTRVVILQHPHEFQHKTTNRSVPLLDLCVSPLDLCVGRRFGELIPGHIQSLLQPPHLPILIFPPLPEEQQDSDKIYCSSLTELQEKISHWKKEQQQQQQPTCQQTPTPSNDDNVVTPKIVLLALDATWKYAKEMHRANLKGNHYPSHMLRLSLRQKDDMPHDFQPRRFELRTTPQAAEAESWMSTAECVAWILSRIEEDPQPENDIIYTSILRIIDAAVEQQRSFRTMMDSSKHNRNKKHKTGEHTPDTAK